MSLFQVTRKTVFLIGIAISINRRRQRTCRECAHVARTISPSSRSKQGAKYRSRERKRRANSLFTTHTPGFACTSRISRINTHSSRFPNGAVTRRILLSLAMAEFNSSRSLVDVIETTAEAMWVMKRDGVFQEYFTPEARYYPDDVKAKGKNGLSYLGDRETYNSLGFNTTLISPNEAPRTLRNS